jgi:23S rRNA (pseudouridine1915-N3)-methyltransferase
MRLHLIAVSKRPPAWVEQGYYEFAKRLPTQCALGLIQIAPGRPAKSGDRERLLKEEGDRMLAAIPAGSRVIALEVRGSLWSTEDLAERLRQWLVECRDVALLIGGPEGLSSACRERADELWSLSRLTLPHALARIVVAEQIYRAWSILQHHPYHRGG